MMRKYRLAFIFLLLVLYAAFGTALWLELSPQGLELFPEGLGLNAAHWVGIAGILAAATGWSATAWNLAGLVGVSTGVGVGVALLAGGLAALYSEGDSSLRCAGIYDNNPTTPAYKVSFIEP